MTCCRILTDAAGEDWPFGRTLATGYYDGPFEGFTECTTCGRAYSFRKLDWGDGQDVRVFSFAPLAISLRDIAARLLPNADAQATFMLVPPLPAAEDNFCEQLLAQRPTHVVACQGWPGRALSCRDATKLDLDSVSDWFAFLGLSRSAID